MQELIKQIVEKTGIAPEKAQQVLGVVAGYVKQRFPIIGGQIDSVLGNNNQTENKSDNKSGNPLGDIGSKFGF